MPPVTGVENDPYLWLEDVNGEKALAWVLERDAESRKALETDPGFKPLYDRLLAILDSEEQIPFVEKAGDALINVWQDARNVRGLWRRTTLDEYRKTEPRWETLLDLDSLGLAENENWVWKSADYLEPGYRRCLVSLSRGGADATVVREFDLSTKSFVENGFSLPEAKSSLSWIDENAVFVGTDFGAGSMTSSGYPRIAKYWKRGTPLAEATTVFEGKPEDVGVFAYKDFSPGHEKEFVLRIITTWSSELHVRRNGEWVHLDLPLDASASTHFDRLFVSLRSDWAVGGRTWPAGALLVASFDGFMAGSRDFTMLFEPGSRTSLHSYASLRDAILVNTLDNVRGRVAVWEPKNGAWASRRLADIPPIGSVYAKAVDGDYSNDYWLIATDFVTPTSLFLGRVDPASEGRGAREKLKALPAFYNTEGLELEQLEATSADGTRIPYFQVGPRGAAADRPTLLYGYGGFEVSMVPWYAASAGTAWLERGNVFVVANIRGGGEFGPAWHQAALKENRHRAYEDFIAVAEDLIRRKVTSAKHLGIQGGSNGGLLVGNLLTMRPDLFGAVVCQSPLLDMRRYHQLLAGASWMEEYGNPDDPGEWAFIRSFSPYHNLEPGVHYPPVLFTSSTRDDRVHPGHARKMVARMMEMGQDVLYYENVEGGHAGAADHKQTAFMSSLEYTFLRHELEKE